MALKKIVVKGAKEHNLKDITVDMPRDQLIVITGLSGSGKSSLAFDTIFAEGQRRYVESLSAYARQFLGQMQKPDVEYIEGLSPAISIDQKTTSRNPRSTVGTVTEIYDYLRLLFARIGIPHCPNGHGPITQQTTQQIVDQILEMEDGKRFQILAPVIKGKKGEHRNLLANLQREGYVRVRIDGNQYLLEDEINLDKNQKHNIEVIIDRLVMKEDIIDRLTDSLETALQLADDTVIIDKLDGDEKLYSTRYACAVCGFSITELEPRMFSFNSPFGACPVCEGIGYKRSVDPDKLISDENLSINEGVIIPWNLSSSNYYPQLLKGVKETFGVDLDTPWKDLSKKDKDIILFGNQDKKIKMEYRFRRGGQRKYETYYEGVVNHTERRYVESDRAKDKLEQFMSFSPCEACGGHRLKPSSLAVYVGEKNISEITELPIEEALKYFEDLELTKTQELIGHQIFIEIKERLAFLVNVGLNYLTLSRNAGTLSGGEAQRIRLATQIGSGLTGVLYILDEPSIGLHQRDNKRLINTLKGLRDIGNTLIVVEHDEETIRESDYIIDVGPGAGVHGGEVVAKGQVEDIINEARSITGQYLSGKKNIEKPDNRREPNGKWLTVVGAAENNLKDIEVAFPLGTFTCVTGVSGSGKSSLVNEILFKSLAKNLNRRQVWPGKHVSIEGMEQLDKVIEIDQSPIGRTPRSNPATYTKTFDYIRDLFAETQMAKIRGYNKGRFSFNLKGGRCEACKGHGINKIEMHFLPDIYVPCEVCNGARYNRETLQVKYKDKTIADVLNMTVEQALEFFEHIPTIEKKLRTIYDVGLGYIKLGQPATQLSGGEAQRVKLATELSKRSTGNTIYLLDEPTTGLHMEDISKLLVVLQRLVDSGNTVIVIEHNLDVIKCADYIIDLGPEGGDKGGTVVAKGKPEEVAKVERSYTGQFLKNIV
ncbi:MAG: excinuclease ABC subunit UvrA [Clostridia bacterium]